MPATSDKTPAAKLCKLRLMLGLMCTLLTWASSGQLVAQVAQVDTAFGDGSGGVEARATAWYQQQGGVGLEALIRRAVARAPAILSANAKVAAASAQLSAGKVGFAPQLIVDAYLRRLGDFGRAGVPETAVGGGVNPDTQSAQASVLLPTRRVVDLAVNWSLTELAFSQRLALSRLKAEQGVRAAEGREAALRVAVAVAQLYAQHALAQARVQHEGARSERQQRLLAAVVALQRAGRMARGDVALAAADARGVEAALAEATGEVTALARVLRLWAGIGPRTPISTKLSSLTKAPAAALESAPSLARLASERSVTEATMEQQRWSILPDFYVGGGLTLANPNFQIVPVEETARASWRAELGVRWRLRQGIQDRLALKAARQSLAAQNYAYEDERERLVRERASLEARLTALQAQEAARREALAQIEVALAAADARFRGGRISLFEVQGIETRVSDAFLALLKVRGERARLQVSLAELSGRLPGLES